MPFVKKEILDRLLKEEQDWLKLLEARETAARQLGYEAAKLAAESQVSSANQLTTDAEARVDELNREAAQLRSQLDGLSEQYDTQNELLKDAYRSRDRDIRAEALAHATRLEEGDIVAKAKEFETFLRGEADPVHNDADRVDGLEESVRLVNSGWNSALEYLRGELYGKMPEGDYADVVEFLATLKREA